MRFTLLMHRFVVVLLLEPLDVGARFSTAEWPLHATVVPTFFTDAEPAALGAALENTALPALVVPALGDALFGARGTVPVTELSLTPALRSAHDALVSALGDLRPETPEHWGDGYRPHVTVKKYARVRPGAALRFVQVALVDMRPGQDRGERAVLSVRALPR